jgi:hypothetical protein
LNEENTFLNPMAGGNDSHAPGAKLVESAAWLSLEEYPGVMRAMIVYDNRDHLGGVFPRQAQEYHVRGDNAFQI